MTTTKEGALLAEHAADLLAGIPRPAKPRDPVDQVDGVSLTEMNRYQWQQDPNRRPRYAGELYSLAAGWVDSLRTECAIKKYARWIGELHSSGDYRYQPLPGDHRAAGDCRALIRLLRGLAAHQADAD
ncbi:hypothetical protein [Streptomyces sp. CA2R106]|uniref:hypothetical protein n=1 Tax=Streptomyces sp. CA2R106 TaxID=3120153 RepID=UPI003009E800